ncbi:cellulase family glycosylhydrolase [Nakamurella sp. GG22]
MPAFAGPTDAAAPTDNAWLHTDGSRIVTETGDEVIVRAVNWFGMETSNCAPHGLWQISLDQAMDQIASFGFTAIRLPYSSECLAGSGSSVSGVDSRVNPDLQQLSPLQIMDRVVDAAAARNLQIILDRHRPDSGSQSELWYTDRFPEQQWISDWVSLAERYRDRPTVIGADLHNEPHGSACWGCGDPATDWAAAATRAGDAVLAVNPHWLIFVEGVERQHTGGSTWWGGGLADAAAHPIELAVPHQLVYSAHDYPASVFAQTWFAATDYPGNLPAMWDRNWGYLQQQEIAPVLLGEFGTKLATESDRAWLDTLVRYIDDRKVSFAYWSYNPNSGDTGGLVADDWRTPQQAKLDALAPLLEPHASPTRPPATTPPATTPAATTPTATVPTATTPTATTPTATTPTSTATPTTATPPAESAISARWSLQNQWATGYVAEIVLTAADRPVHGWTLSWPDPHAVAVSSSWGMTCTAEDDRVSCTGTDWAAELAAGGSVRVGLVAAADGAAPVAPVLTAG